MTHEEKGSLYIVSTPIGHLADITYRAVEVLKAVHLIAAEDTRHTRKLLNRYQIDTPLSSYHSYNQFKKGPALLKMLGAGKDLALVTDAGTPGISDPSYQLVRSAAAAGITVHPIPGPVAAVAALTVSGLPMNRFVFEGFLPVKKGRQTRLRELAEEKRTLVIFESPHRMARTLRDLHAALGDRPVAVARELTKIHEEVIRCGLAELAADSGRKWKGEITLVISAKPIRAQGPGEN